jgi:hypothetical protein
LQVFNNCNNIPSDESLGIRDVNILLLNKTANDTESIYQQGLYPAYNNVPDSVIIPCNPGQYLNGTKCTNCPNGCKICTFTPDVKCQICMNNYFYSNMSCLHSAANCRTCSGLLNNSCTSCNPGYYLFNDGTCRNYCWANGNISVDSPMRCNCNPGHFVYKNNTCLYGCNLGYSVDNFLHVHFCVQLITITMKTDAALNYVMSHPLQG